MIRHIYEQCGSKIFPRWGQTVILLCILEKVAKKINFESSGGPIWGLTGAWTPLINFAELH